MLANVFGLSGLGSGCADRPFDKVEVAIDNLRSPNETS
jgi:hypothetical protein